MCCMPALCSQDKTEGLEEQKKALKRDCAERMERMREQLEKEREEDKAKYLQEIETLRQQNLYTPIMDDSDSDPRRSSTYDLLQSVAFSPIHRDISERVVEGKEGDRQCHTPTSLQSPGGFDSRKSSTLSSTPYSGVFKRSATAEDQNMSLEKDGRVFLLDNQGVGHNGFCVVSELRDERDGDSG